VSYAAKILADSVSPNGHRLTTFEVTFPRIVLAEFNTHRQFSRNSASSRAIPVKKMLERVRENPFVPSIWGKNQKGMQASEILDDEDEARAVFAWRELRNHARNAAWYLAGPESEGGLDVHKQIANRLLEPWLWHTCIVSATEWGNFWNLRDNKMAQPEIHTIASLMHELYKASEPHPVNYNDWHLPLVPPDEAFNIEVADVVLTAAKISAGRCARVSYLTHDGRRDHAEDLRLHDTLLASGHMSPLEHPARPMNRTELELFARADKTWDAEAGHWGWLRTRSHFCGNFNGWVQLRKLVPGEADIHTHRGTSA
jgi:thymidylate synthase ThyX